MLCVVCDYEWKNQKKTVAISKTPPGTTRLHVKTFYFFTFHISTLISMLKSAID